jgi:large subunit ribosomal protein L10
MPREKKVQIIDDLKDLIARSNIGILTDYRGLSASEMNVLRRRLDGLGVDYRVVKNTLARFAVKKAGRDELTDLFEGPVAIAFGYGEVTELARSLDEYIRTSKTSLSIKGGFLSDRLLTSEEVTVLSKLPSREILLGKVLGGMQAPTMALLACLTAPMRGMVGVLQARIQQMEAK